MQRDEIAIGRQFLTPGGFVLEIVSIHELGPDEVQIIAEHCRIDEPFGPLSYVTLAELERYEMRCDQPSEPQPLPPIGSPDRPF